MRSLINTLESIAIPSVKAMAAMPGKVSVACKIDKMAIKNSKLKVKEMPRKYQTCGNTKS
jgi:hypothetical protein